MSHRDVSAIAVAALALLMASAAWIADAFGPAAARPFETALDRAKAVALETQGAGQPLTWRDPATGKVAVIAAAAAFRDRDGNWCRPYTITLGPAAARQGVDCRTPKGDWRPRPAARRPVTQQIAAADLREAWLDRLAEDGPGR